MKATKDFRAVKPGEIYPVEVRKGEEIPKELEQKAHDLGAAEKTLRKAMMKAPENK